MFVKALPKCLFKTDRLGASTTFLGSLFYCLTTLSENKGFLMSNLNLLWHSFGPFPHILSLGTRGNRSGRIPVLTKL